MEIDSDEELLHRLAAGGTMNYDLWPRLLETVIARLHEIVENEYPIPVIPPPRRTQSKLPQPTWPNWSHHDAANGVGVASSSRAPVSSPSRGVDAGGRPDVDKENNDPDSAAGPSTAASESSSSSNGPSSSSAAVAAPAEGAENGSSRNGVAAPDAVPRIPRPVLEQVDYIITTLKTTFRKYPPHSIQRLAELIIAPRQHYRYLAPYLHAVDRVVSVTSGSNAFPLPPAVPEPEAMEALQAAVIPSAPADPEDEDMDGGGLALAANPASDDPLGALLTPIPWLRQRPPSGAGTMTDDDGSSPPSSSDGSDMAFSATSSTAGSVHGGGANASRAPASLLQQQQQQQQQQAQSPVSLQGHPPQHRMEVRTEATETIDGPNGVGSIETVSVSINGIPSHGAMMAAVQRQQQRGITQGELLRQEQTAGVVPVSQLARVAAARAAAASGMPGFGDRFRPGAHDNDDEDDEDDENDDMDEDDDDDMARHAHGGRPGVTAPTGSSRDAHARPKAHEDTDMGGTESEKPAASAREGKPTKQDKGKGPAGKHNDDDNKNEDKDDDEEIPHARGPQEIGAADMGPQRPSSRLSTAAAGGSNGKGSAGLLIGSAADASQMDMRDIDVEAAVGRKASALPPGTVAAPVVPFSSRESVRESAGEAESDAAGAPRATTPSARSTTPKREAENELQSDGPVKKRKEDHGEGSAVNGSTAAPAAAIVSSAVTVAESKKTGGQESETKSAEATADHPADPSSEKGGDA
ncbi:hypothetical protein SPBR_01377 [Sporothrix brasiliensis 5110]|uniref:Uncharacterized protein n=1 Tax=Sporothrix brasiliensis 5110 TaxID=1398154 RepID=A0A0C2FKR1_9PEZI|nr:uncharacterized protein SPBR_01377 [Sporothrix brasiliensis 5110]KIH91638.1 hypothetical protein SPBR_01377 [Sporothrix brasiliensis 5110]